MNKNKKCGKKKSFHRIKMVKTPKQISTNDYSFSENGFPKHFKELEEIVTETFQKIRRITNTAYNQQQKSKRRKTRTVIKHNEPLYIFPFS